MTPPTFPTRRYCKARRRPDGTRYYDLYEQEPGEAERLRGSTADRRAAVAFLLRLDPPTSAPRMPCQACVYDVDPRIDEGYSAGTADCPVHGPMMQTPGPADPCPGT